MRKFAPIAKAAADDIKCVFFEGEYSCYFSTTLDGGPKLGGEDDPIIIGYLNNFVLPESCITDFDPGVVPKNEINIMVTQPVEEEEEEEEGEHKWMLSGDVVSISSHY